MTLKSLRGKVVVLTFWASYCPHCQKELKQAAGFEEVLSRHGNTEYYLVDKLDGQKETKENALDYLKDNGISLTTLFDQNAAVYRQLGIDPTQQFLNTAGRPVPMLANAEAISELV